MSEQEFSARLSELMDQVGHLPEAERQRLEQLAEETKQRRQRMSETVNQLQESLDYLRLSVKYLVFDLEATRRENKYLRDLLRRGADEESDSAD